MMVRRRTLFTLVLAMLLVSTTVRAQEVPPEPPTPTVIPTELPTLTPIPTDLPTVTPIPTELPTLEPSFTPLPLPTETETETPTAIETATNTEVASATASLTPSMTATAAETATSSATASATASLTPSLTASATSEVEDFVAAQDVQALNVTCDPSANVSLISVDSSGVSGNGNASQWDIALSNNDRYVYYLSAATNLVPNDTNGVDDIFRFDRETCQTVRVSTDVSGGQTNGASSQFGVSEDGQTFVFRSAATNLISGEADNGLFVRNFTNDTLIHIPDSNTNSQYPTISADGRYVAYIESVDTSSYHLMVYDVLTNQNSAAVTTILGNKWAKISRDGSVIAYFSGNSAVSIYDLSTSQSTALPISANMALFDISADGRYIAFGSSATNLVPNDTNGVTDIFVYDGQAEIIFRVSVSYAGAQAASQSAFPSISADGRYVSFIYSGNDLVSGDTNNASDVYVRDLVLGRTYLVSTGVNGEIGNNGAGGAWLPFSADNQYLAFGSNASNLVTGDTNVHADIFVTKFSVFQENDLATKMAETATAGAPTVVAMTATAGATLTQAAIQTNAAATATAAAVTPSRTPLPTLTYGAPVSILPCTPSAAMVIASVDSNGAQGMASSRGPYVSTTGRYVVYESYADNLVSGDTNAKIDVFVFDRETCQTRRASTAANGTQANQDSGVGSISSDGRYVTFMSRATNLVAGDSDNLWDLYIKDMQTGAITRLQAGYTSNGYGNGMAFIAGDNHTVVYKNWVTNTISLYDIQTQVQTNLVTANNLELVQNAISADLRYLVFSSNVSNLIASDTNNVTDVFLLDRNTSQITRVSVSSSSEQSNSHSYYASITADGRYVAFMSLATNLVGNKTTNGYDIFVRDLQTGITSRVSVSSAGLEGNSSSGYATLSDDARYVTFLSEASNLVSNDNNNLDDIFVRDRTTGQTYLINRSTNNTSGNGYSDRPMMARDGSYVGFSSGSSNLVEGDANYSVDIFVARRADFAPTAWMTATAGATLTQAAIQTNAAATATAAAVTPSRTPLPTLTYGAPVSILPCTPSASMVIASVDSNGAQGMASSQVPYVSATGRYVVYESFADNLVNGDTNNMVDVFIFDREVCQTIRASVSANGTQANGHSGSAAVSSDGRYVAFTSFANNLAAGDSDALSDGYIKDLQTGIVTRIPTGVFYNREVYFMSDDHNVIFRTDNSLIRYDLLTQTSTVLITVSNLDVVRNAVSNDFRYVVFSSSLTNLVAGDTNNLHDVFLLDRETNQTTRLSVSATGDQSNAMSYNASISGNGRYVVFNSSASNIVPNVTNGLEVLVRDLQDGTINRVAVTSDGTAANQSSSGATISDDGRYIVFTSSATNLDVNDDDDAPDIFVRDQITNQTYMISRPVVVANEVRSSHSAIISRDGNFITFSSYSTKLVIGDANYAEDIFVARRADFVPPVDTPATQTAVAQATATYSAANTIVVNSVLNTTTGTCTVGSCTLPQALALSESLNGVQTITFNLSPVDGYRIRLNDTLRITSSVIIDGTTQAGYAGTPLIELVPNQPTIPTDAIIVNGASTITYDPNTSVTIRGLVIGGFQGSAISMGNGQGHLIEDNYIGTNAAGTVARANDTGIIMRAPNSIIRNNLVSGNRSTGIYLYSNAGRNSTNNVIVGNFIGTDITGTVAIPNQMGMRIVDAASNNLIGGDTPEEANVISGNLNQGILVDGNIYAAEEGIYTDANTISGNIIGLDANGQYLLSNGLAGIQIINATNTVVGGTTFAAGNQIWGNLGGVVVSGQTGSSTIRNNVIAQNGMVGISVSGNNTAILENVIAFHSNVGIQIGSGTGNRMSMNRVYSNAGLGIDLGSTYSVLPNDAGDVDTGANELQNYPVISSVTNSITGSTITGSLSSKANSTYRVEFFSNNQCDANGYGEGQVYIGYTDVTTNASGVANFTASLPSILENTTFGMGWSGVFYPSNNLSGTGVPVSGINGLNFNWGTAAPVVNSATVAGIPSDQFSARFTSTQSFAAGNYTFNVSADDGVRVYIDGVLKLDKFVGRPLTTDQFTTALTAGNHTLTVEYFDSLDQARLQFNWYAYGTTAKAITSTAADASGNTSGFSACQALQNVLGLGSYQETNVNFAYQGTWMSLIGAGNGGSFKYTNDANARLSFWVDSSVTRITFYRTTHPQYGSTQIYLDSNPTPFATMSNVSSSIIYGVAYTIVIPAGNHKIELRNVGTSYSTVDQIDLQPPAVALSASDTAYQETDAKLTYVGNWVQNANASALGGSRRFTNDPNARVSFNINNSVGRVSIYRTTYQTGVYGSMQIFVDGGLVATMPNNPNPTLQFGVPFTFAVTPGSHTVELRNVGSTYSDIDQIKLMPAAVPLTTAPEIYHETEVELSYSGNWVQNANPNALSGARRFTNDPNARVSFKVNNSVERITIYRTIYQAGVYGTMQVYVDGVLNGVIANNTSTTFQYGVPYTFTVTPGDHTIELRNVGSTYSDLDQIKLEAAADPLTTTAGTPPGTYQETEANLTYTGNWVTASVRRYTNDPNGRVSFNIDESVGRITIYRAVYQAGVYGALQIYVDGVLNGTINNTGSTTLQLNQPYTFTVTPGDHTIELRNVGSTYSDLDQIKLEAAADPLTTTAGTPPGIYQETDVNITYTGNWVTAAVRRYTNDPNGRVSFNIDESVGRITIYRAVYQAGIYGSLQIYVDGVLNGTINNTGSTTLQLNQPYTFTVTPGDHRIELRNVGSTYSDLDQIKLEAPTNPLTITPGTYQENNPELTYTGNWGPAANGLSGGRRYTNDPNGRVSFNIDDSVGRITIYRTIYQTGVYGSLQVYVDGVLNGTIINNPSTAFQFGVPYTFTVTPGEHRIELRNIGSTYSDLDQIKLEAPIPNATATPNPIPTQGAGF